MCGGDCGSKHQVMLDTIAKLDFKLNEANGLLDMYREQLLEDEREIERLHTGIDTLQRKLSIGEYQHPCS